MSKKKEQEKKSKKDSAPTAQGHEENDTLETRNEIVDQLEALKQENEKLKDKLLRNAAEFENFQRRTEAEKVSWIKYSTERIILKLCDVLDNFERAFETDAEDHSLKSFSEGIKLIYNQLLKIFHEEGVEKIEAVGKDFDPNYHDALAQTPSQLEKDKVAQVVQNGYVMNNRVIRAAKVLVSSGEIVDSNINNNENE